MLYLAENNRIIIIVGVPGVGKTTLLDKMNARLKNCNHTVSVVSFGTLMLEVGMDNGLKDRDHLRKLPLSEQKRLQRIAAERIAKYSDDTILVDTHTFIKSPEGYYPGLPKHVLDTIKPTNFISVAARPEEIYNRRMRDTTRNRDHVTLESVKEDLDVQSGMISACSIITGSPVKHVLNSEGKVDEVADSIVDMMEL